MDKYPVAEWADLHLWGYTMQEVAAFYAVSTHRVWRRLFAAGVRARCGQPQNLGNPVPSGRSRHVYHMTQDRDGRSTRVHRVAWATYHGPIPNGHVVHHRNGDTLDNRIENLACMTPSEHAKLHKQRATEASP